MPDFDELTTARLELRPMSVDDTDELFGILNDPRGWLHQPAARHLDIETTRAFAQRASDRWKSDGLSYWSARRPDTGAIIGLGGAQRHRSGGWNLSYRIATAEYGKGYAAELARAGLDAAHACDPESAVVAWILAHHTPSIRVAQRVGLTDYGPRIDTNDGIERLAYADRPI